MKIRIIIVSFLSLSLLLSSCDKIKDLLTTKVSTDFSVDLPVAITSDPLKATTGEFNTTNTFDPLDNEDLAKYKDKIKGFDLTGLTGTVSLLSTPVTLTNVELIISSGQSSVAWNFASVPLTNGTVITFDNTTGQWDKINDILNEQKIVTVKFSGSSTQSNVTFTFTVKFSADATAKIL